MYPPNRTPTELYYSRQALLMQEAHNRRLARRQRRAARSVESPRSVPLRKALARARAVWERTRVAFLRA
jgi:hypothetical protein